jgi:hypothetical protein
MKESPYLVDNDRLADVIAAIQTLGTYKFYKLTFAAWADRITGDEGKADHLQKVFEDHPEFFRLDSKRERASLVWRRQHQKVFNVDTEQKVSPEVYDALSQDQKSRVSRTPLGSSELAILINTAIDLHSRALERKQDTRWWITGAIGLVTGVIGLVGVIVGAYIQALVE